MKLTFIILLFAFLTLIAYFFILGAISKSKEMPKLVNGILSKCPNSPNCICTEYEEHKNHYISPINISSNNTPLASLKGIVEEMGGEIKVEDKNYFSATFSSNLFGFVDNLEIRVDEDNHVIHLRSASRVGRSDFGVNKKRILLIKQYYKNK